MLKFLSKNKKNNYTLLGEGINILKPMNQDLEPIKIMDKNRKGHFFIFGTTRIGKSRLAENIIEQDIRKGYSVFLVDPKGDIDLLNKIVQIAHEEKRLDELILINPIFPELSAKIDPLSFYSIPEELTNHVVSGIKADEEFFINVAEETTSAIINSLLILNEFDPQNSAEVNFNAILRHCSHKGLEELQNELAKIKSDYAIETKDSLDRILQSPPDFFAKISSSLRTVLNSLSTGVVGSIMGKATTNDFMKRLEQNKSVIVVLQTGSLMIGRTASMVARVLISMIQAFAGRKSLSGKKCDPPLSLIMDEFSNIAYFTIADLFNKAGGANIYCTALTQSLADLYRAIGEDASRQILDNTNSKIFMRVNDPSTADYISSYSGEVDKFTPIMQMGGNATIRSMKEALISTLDVQTLKEREFYYFGFEGIFKGKSSFVPESSLNIVYPNITTVKKFNN
jgi:type IV secretory pathway TraG/TraD family ATPase VirD4